MLQEQNSGGSELLIPTFTEDASGIHSITIIDILPKMGAFDYAQSGMIVHINIFDSQEGSRLLLFYLSTATATATAENRANGHTRRMSSVC